MALSDLVVKPFEILNILFILTIGQVVSLGELSGYVVPYTYYSIIHKN